MQNGKKKGEIAGGLLVCFFGLLDGLLVCWLTVACFGEEGGGGEEKKKEKQFKC